MVLAQSMTKTTEKCKKVSFIEFRVKICNSGFSYKLLKEKPHKLHIFELNI